MKSNRRAFAQALAAGGLGLASAEASATSAKGRRIRKAEVLPVGIPFQSEFKIGVGTVGGKGKPGRYVLVRLETEDGQVGWGMTNTVPNWAYETIEAVVGTLKNYLVPLAAGKTPFEWNALKKEMDATIRPAVSNGAPFAKSALEIAFLDLAGKVAGLPIHQMLGGKVRDTIDLCYAVSIDTPQAMAAEVKKWPACKCFKVKVAGDPDEDVKRLEAITAARPDIVIWLDANQSYQPIRLERFLEALKDFDNIRCFEQPVRSEDWMGLRRAREKSPSKTERTTGSPGLRRAREKSPYPIAIDEGARPPALGPSRTPAMGPSPVNGIRWDLLGLGGMRARARRVGKAWPHLQITRPGVPNRPSAYIRSENHEDGAADSRGRSGRRGVKPGSPPPCAGVPGRGRRGLGARAPTRGARRRSRC